MGLINKKRQLESGMDREPRVMDRVIIFEQDGKLCEILPVQDINEDRILAPNYSIPWQDLQEFMTPEGRVFVLNAPEEYILETKHLATVEQATIIRHAIQYEKMMPEKGDFSRILPWIAVVVIAIFAILKK